jgi:hypothetical protein
VNLGKKRPTGLGDDISEEQSKSTYPVIIHLRDPY